MKILHIIDESYFQSHRKTISELILSLNENQINQEVLTSIGADLGWISSIVPLNFWKVSKSGKFNTFFNKFSIWRKVSQIMPEVVIKWGKNARMIAPAGNFVQVSFINEFENLKTFDKTDYLMTNLESVLSYVKSNGFSGGKSFLIPPFFQEYKNIAPMRRNDLFIPEKPKILYIAGSFLKGIGYETMFDSISSISDVYFIIFGSGKDEEYVKNYASRVNMKSRSRFVSDVERSFIALDLCDIAILPFDDVELHKNILEAMLARKIVVTIKNNIAEEFITDGKTGFIVPKKDTYFLRKKVKEVMAMSDEDREVILDNAYNFAESYLGSKVVPNYINIFKELILKYKFRKNLLHN